MFATEHCGTAAGCSSWLRYLLEVRLKGQNCLKKFWELWQKTEMVHWALVKSVRKDQQQKKGHAPQDRPVVDYALVEVCCIVLGATGSEQGWKRPVVGT